MTARRYIAQWHATERGPGPDKTLCGLRVEVAMIDNAHPSCKTCLRVIAARLRAVTP